MQRPVAFDLTRLFLGPMSLAPRGIDRVDLGYSRHFLTEWGAIALEFCRRRGESVVFTGTDLCEWSTTLRSSGARQVMRMLIRLMTTLGHGYMGGQLRLGLPNRYPLFG